MNNLIQGCLNQILDTTFKRKKLFRQLKKCNSDIYAALHRKLFLENNFSSFMHIASLFIVQAMECCCFHSQSLVANKHKLNSFHEKEMSRKRRKESRQ